MAHLFKKVLFNDQSWWIQIAQIVSFRVRCLVEKIGLSRRQIERYIKRHFQLTPAQWLLNLRMARAAELVRVTSSVKEIAYTLGFTHVSTFCRQFKAHHGMTCSEYAAMIVGAPGAGNAPTGKPASFVWSPTEAGVSPPRKTSLGPVI